ncbi:hypothetical protein V1523DRAFT_81374 [Lipomyces doorenjongii]
MTWLYELHKYLAVLQHRSSTRSLIRRLIIAPAAPPSLSPYPPLLPVVEPFHRPPVLQAVQPVAETVDVADVALPQLDHHPAYTPVINDPYGDSDLVISPDPLSTRVHKCLDDNALLKAFVSRAVVDVKRILVVLVPARSRCKCIQEVILRCVPDVVGSLLKPGLPATSLLHLFVDRRRSQRLLRSSDHSIFMARRHSLCVQRAVPIHLPFEYVLLICRKRKCVVNFSYTEAVD